MGGNTEAFGVKGRDSKLIDLQRKIRPYRHAILSLVHPAAGSPEITLIKNEFADGLLNGIDATSGVYEIRFNTSAFKNPDRVFAEATIAHTTLTVPVSSSYFNTTVKDLLTVLIFDTTFFNTADVDGEILITLKEFYE